MKEYDNEKLRLEKAQRKMEELNIVPANKVFAKRKIKYHEKGFYLYGIKVMSEDGEVFILAALRKGFIQVLLKYIFFFPLLIVACIFNPKENDFFEITSLAFGFAIVGEIQEIDGE